MVCFQVPEHGEKGATRTQLQQAAGDPSAVNGPQLSGGGFTAPAACSLRCSNARGTPPNLGPELPSSRPNSQHVPRGRLLTKKAQSGELLEVGVATHGGCLCPRRLMQRPPIACRRAAHSITALNAAPQQHIWISDELLASTVNRFFRTGCAHQKRHGSHVPGPLEARKRGVKRQMTVQTQMPQFDVGMPLFNLRTLFGRRSSPESSWRYEPPSPPAATGPSHDSSNAQDPRHAAPLGSAVSSGERSHRRIVKDPTTQSTSSMKAAKDDGPGLQRDTHKALQCFDWLEPPPSAEGDRDLLSSDVPTMSDIQPAPRMNIPDDAMIHNTSKEIGALRLKLSRVLEEGLSRTNDPDAFLQGLETWFRVATPLSNRERSRSLDIVCKKGYAILGHLIDTKVDSTYQIPRGNEAPQLTLRILQLLIAHNWSLGAMDAWLAKPYVPLPLLSTPGCTEFLSQLDLMFAKHKARPTGLRFLYPKLASQASKETLDERTSRNLEQVKLFLYRAEWGRIVQLHSLEMKPNEIGIVSKLADLVTDTVTQDPQQRIETNHEIVDYLGRLKASRPDAWELTYGYILPLLPAHLTWSEYKGNLSAGLKDRGKSAHTAPVVTQGRKMESDASSVDTQELSAFLSGSAQPAPDIDTYTTILEVQNILDLARNAHVLAQPYQDWAADKVLGQRAEIFHQLAYQYSIDHTRSLSQKRRSLIRLYQHLIKYNLPLGPLFTKAMVHVFITQPMSQNVFVSAKTMIWVCRCVERVEGFEVARKIADVFFRWKGDTIQQAQNRFHQLGGKGPARIRTFNQLEIPIHTRRCES